MTFVPGLPNALPLTCHVALLAPVPVWVSDSPAVTPGAAVAPLNVNQLDSTSELPAESGSLALMVTFVIAQPYRTVCEAGLRTRVGGALVTVKLVTQLLVLPA